MKYRQTVQDANNFSPRTNSARAKINEKQVKDISKLMKEKTCELLLRKSHIIASFKNTLKS